MITLYKYESSNLFDRLVIYLDSGCDVKHISVSINNFNFGFIHDINLANIINFEYTNNALYLECNDSKLSIELIDDFISINIYMQYEIKHAIYASKLGFNASNNNNEFEELRQLLANAYNLFQEKN